MHDFDLAAPFAWQQIVGRQALHGAVDVHSGEIHFVQSDDNRNFCRTGMADGLFGLRHDAVVGCHDQHGNVGHVSAAGAHLGKGFMAGSVDERNLPAVFVDGVGTNVLGDAAALAAHDVDADDVVQERSLTMVDVPQESNHRRARRQRGLVVLLLANLPEQLVFEGDRFLEFDIHA